ncbi:MAG: hypothetical protein IJO46_01105 [Thermoguttaceae bacterium]|nr:hypothetical protein [Thermoguttaceae bacterium]
MKFHLKSFLSTALLVAGFVYFENSATPNVFAQDAPNAEAPAEAPAPAPAPAEAPEPAPAPAPNPAAVLEMERAAKAKTPEIFEKLVFDKTFSRRIPNYWNALKLTKRQKNAIYALQQEYFAEILQLQARIERLEAERDARYREVLTPKQKEALDAKLAEVEKSRADKAEAKEAAEEAEAEAAIK